MPRHLFAVSLLCLSISNAAQRYDPDSLRSVAHDPALHDTIRLNAMELQVRQYMNRNHDSVMAITDRMTLAAHTGGHLKWEGWAMNAQGMTLEHERLLVEAMERYERAYALREAAGDLRGMSASRLNIGNLYSAFGQSALAVQHLEQAARLAKESGNAQQSAHVFLMIANLNAKIGENERSRQYLQRAMACSTDNYLYSQILVEVGRNAHARGEMDEALRVLRHAIDTMRVMGEETRMAYAEVHLGRAFLQLKQFDSAEVHLRRSLAIAEANDSRSDIADARFFLAYMQQENGDIKGAIRTAQQVLVDLGDLQSDLMRRNVYELLRDSHKALGNDSKALEYSERYMEMDKAMNQREQQRATDQFEFRERLVADSLKQAAEALAVKEAHDEAMGAETTRKRLFMFGGAGVLAVAIGLWFLLGRTRKAKAASEEILYNVLPEEVAKEITEKGAASSKEIDQVSILFTDIKGFTALSEKLSRTELMAELDTCFNAFDSIIGEHGVEKIKTIGDSYMCAAGLKGDPITAACNMVLAGLAMQDFMREHKQQSDAEGKPPFEMRLGIHTGPVVAGIVGVKKFQYDIWGDTVNTASRMESSGEPGKVNISEATYELVKNVRKERGVEEEHDPQRATHQPVAELAFKFTPRGKVQAKGKGEMEMFFVELMA